MIDGWLRASRKTYSRSDRPDDAPINNDNTRHPKMKMASGSSAAQDSEQSEEIDAFQTFASGPVAGAYLTLDVAKANQRAKAKNKTKAERPLSGAFGFINGLRSPTATSPTQSPPVLEPLNHDEPLDEFGRRLMRRSSMIMSSGRDKYTYDSEGPELNHRSIDVYEKKMGNSSRATSPAASPTPFLVSGHGPRLARRTASQLSSGSGSDRTPSTRSDNRSDIGSALSSGSSSPRSLGSHRGGATHINSTTPPALLRIKRDSVVPSAQDVSRALFINGRFQNPWESWAPSRFSDILKFGLSKDKSNIPNKEQLDIVLPVVKPHFSHMPPPEDAIRVTWLGHSTVLVEMDGITLLTDPIFSERASPSQVVGPKRYREVPCTVHDLPSKLDAIIISHNHYDHLDRSSVTLLNARYGSELRWFIPLGLSSWFETMGVENLVELDWWEENCVPDKSDVSFVFTPAQHWSKRTLNDDNRSLWGGWAVIGPKHRFYFTGDTGYCPAFKEIGKLYGPFSAAAIPIGAFEPRWFMKYQHVNPDEAVQIHQDLQSQFSFAIHWGTFALANEYYLDPPVQLREALESRSIETDSFITFKHGETRLVLADGKSMPEKTARKMLSRVASLN